MSLSAQLGAVNLTGTPTSLVEKYIEWPSSWPYWESGAKPSPNSSFDSAPMRNAAPAMKATKPSPEASQKRGARRM